MFAEFKNTLRKLRGSIIGWSVGLFLYDLLISSMYSSIVEMGDQFQEFLAVYPEEMIAFFPSISEFTSPIGFFDTYFSAYMTIILGIFAVGAARLLVGDEEKGTLDLVISYPVSRTSLFWGRVLAFTSAIAILLISAWLGWVIPAKGVGLDLSPVDLLLGIFPLFLVMLLFAALALLLSLVLPATRAASAVSGGLLVANFLLVGLSNLNADLKPLYEVTPLYYYQGAQFIKDPNWVWMLGLIVAALLLAALAWVLFLRRDIRVGGEAGWQLPFLGRKREKTA